MRGARARTPCAGSRARSYGGMQRAMLRCMASRTRACLDCGADISNRRRTALRCVPCAHARNIANVKAWRLANLKRACPSCGDDISGSRRKRCGPCGRKARKASKEAALKRYRDKRAGQGATRRSLAVARLSVSKLRSVAIRDGAQGVGANARIRMSRLGYCPTCRKESRRAREKKYQRTYAERHPERSQPRISKGAIRETQRRYHQTKNGKAALKRARQSPAGREAKRRYRESTKGQATERAYRQSEEARETKRAYQQSERGREKRALSAKARAAREKVARERVDPAVIDWGADIEIVDGDTT